MSSQARGSCWSITINNPCDNDEENIAFARAKRWTVSGQKEVGANGTPHYQLIVKTPQVRFSTVKKTFPRAHIELARNPTALALYCEKEDTRVGSLDTSSEWYPSNQKIWDWFGVLAAEYTRGIERDPITLSKRDLTREELLGCFDQMINLKIREGYYCESFAVNPQVRAAVIRYGNSIAYRGIHRQTDRQTRGNNVAAIDTNNAD